MSSYASYLERSSSYVARVYGLMCLMLLLTGVTTGVGLHLHVDTYFMAHPLVLMATVAGLLGTVFFLGWESSSMPVAVGSVLLYCLGEGALLVAAVRYAGASATLLSLVCSTAVFGGATIWGFKNPDALYEWTSWLVFALFGLLFAMIGNFLVHSTVLGYVISAVAVVVFTVFAALDAGRVIQESHSPRTGAQTISSAVKLYLDFLNLFIHLLRIFGALPKKD